MTTEQKQIELLNRHYTNIENYKSLRFTIPTTISTLNLGMLAILVSNLDKLVFDGFKILMYFMLLTFGAFGIVALRLAQRQFIGIAEKIFHLYDKLNICGEDFYPEGLGHRDDPGQRAGDIFWLGYIAIFLTTVMSVIITLYLPFRVR